MKTCCYEKCIRAGEVLLAGLGGAGCPSPAGLVVSQQVPAVMDVPSVSPAAPCGAIAPRGRRGAFCPLQHRRVLLCFLILHAHVFILWLWVVFE